MMSIIEDATTHRTFSEIARDVALQNMLLEIAPRLTRHPKIALH
jgi:hypothetical protein